MNYNDFSNHMGSGVGHGPCSPSLGSDSVEFMETGTGRQTLSGVQVNARTALGYPALWRGFNLIANKVAQLPLLVRRYEQDGGKPEAEDHPAYRLLKKRPSPYVTSKIFRRTLTLHAQMFGNGYAFIQRDGRGNPIDLTILDPQGTFPIKWIPNDTGITEIFYSTSVDGKVFTIPFVDVLHIRHLAMDGLIGISVIDVMREAIGMGMAVRQFGAHFFGQGSNASGLLMVPNTIRPDAQKNLLKHWGEINRGLGNSHKVALVSNGATFTKLTFSPDEAQFLETKRFEIVEIANITGLPPRKLGDNSNSAYNSIEAENRSALDESYEPWLGTWEEECEAKLLTEEEQLKESHVVEFDRSKMLQPTLSERASANRTYSEIGVFTINDILRSEGRETIGPDGDVRHVPVNWQRLGDASSNNEILNLLKRIDANGNRDKTT